MKSDCQFVFVQTCRLGSGWLFTTVGQYYSYGEEFTPAEVFRLFLKDVCHPKHLIMDNILSVENGGENLSIWINQSEPISPILVVQRFTIKVLSLQCRWLDRLLHPGHNGNTVCLYMISNCLFLSLPGFRLNIKLIFYGIIHTHLKQSGCRPTLFLKLSDKKLGKGAMPLMGKSGKW